jgi:hypothetical protein
MIPIAQRTLPSPYSYTHGLAGAQVHCLFPLRVRKFALFPFTAFSLLIQVQVSRGSGAKQRQTAATSASDHRLIEALGLRERKQTKT